MNQRRRAPAQGLRRNPKASAEASGRTALSSALRPKPPATALPLPATGTGGARVAHSPSERPYRSCVSTGRLCTCERRGERKCEPAGRHDRIRLLTDVQARRALCHDRMTSGGEPDGRRVGLKLRAAGPTLGDTHVGPQQGREDPSHPRTGGTPTATTRAILPRAPAGSPRRRSFLSRRHLGPTDAHHPRGLAFGLRCGTKGDPRAVNMQPRQTRPLVSWVCSGGSRRLERVRTTSLPGAAVVKSRRDESSCPRRSRC